MKTNALLVTLLVAAVVQSPSASAYRLERSWQRTFTVKEDCSFVVANTNGPITVGQWERDEIAVRARIRIKAPSKSKAQKIYNKLQFDARQDERRVRIEARIPRLRQDTFFGLIRGQGTSVSVTYNVSVPRTTDLHLETRNGDIEVNDVDGHLGLHTVNGSIGIESPQGEGVAQTVNGGIRCVIASFPEDGDLQLKTVNGEIELLLPGDVNGELHATAAGGRVRVGIELTEKIQVKRSKVRGIFGNGRGTITVSTVNGGVSVRPLR